MAMNISRKYCIGITLLVLIVLTVALICLIPRESRQERLDRALIEAIKARDDQKALEALAEGASGEAWTEGATIHHRHSDQKDEKEHLSALALLFQQAAQDGSRAGPHAEVVRALLDHGANVNDKDEDGTSPLWYASVYFDSNDMIDLLLKRGANINLANNKRRTPLMFASAKTDLFLLNHGANIEAVDEDHRTALMWAVWNDEIDAVNVLLAHGANVKAKDAEGKTVLYYVQDAIQDAPDSNSRNLARKIKTLLSKYGAVRPEGP